MADRKNHAKDLDQQMLAFVDPIGRLLTDGFHILALFAIGAATVWAAAAAFYAMVQKGSATIEDLLLLFIYLEIGSMVGIYFRTNHMPVRFLLYVGITALTRHLIGFVQHEEVADVGVLILASAILILGLASSSSGLPRTASPPPPMAKSRAAMSAAARFTTSKKGMGI